VAGLKELPVILVNFKSELILAGLYLYVFYYLLDLLAVLLGLSPDLEVNSKLPLLEGKSLMVSILSSKISHTDDCLVIATELSLSSCWPLSAVLGFQLVTSSIFNFFSSTLPYLVEAKLKSLLNRSWPPKALVS